MKTMIAKVALGIAFASSLAACGSSGGDDAPVYIAVDGGASSAAEQDQSACAAHPHTLTGTAASGASCGNATSCAPVCCTCATGGRGWSASACVDGVCADAKAACAQSADDARYCN